jgi:hypothetical protein
VALGMAVSASFTALARALVGAFAVRTGARPEGYVDEDFELLQALGGQPELLTFTLGNTTIAYGPVLAHLLALGLVTALAAGVLRLGRRPAVECPHCLSTVPAGAAVCASCSLDLVEPPSGGERAAPDSHG